MKLHFKGKGNYCAVLIDLDKSKLVAILAERTQEKITETLTGWGWSIRANRRSEHWFVALYKSLVEELMPSAQVVADRFHVMKQVNNELDAERKKQKTWGSSKEQPNLSRF